VRDLRSQLLLKLVLGDLCGVDTSAMVRRQREIVEPVAQAFAARVAAGPVDVVGLWRAEASVAALRFLDAVAAGAARIGDD
jgi:hypothetical protein